MEIRMRVLAVHGQTEDDTTAACDVTFVLAGEGARLDLEHRDWATLPKWQQDDTVTMVLS